MSKLSIKTKDLSFDLEMSEKGLLAYLDKIVPILLSEIQGASVTAVLPESAKIKDADEMIFKDKERLPNSVSTFDEESYGTSELKENVCPLCGDEMFFAITPEGLSVLCENKSCVNAYKKIEEEAQNARTDQT